jgi:phage terminase large subunit-like protein
MKKSKKTSKRVGAATSKLLSRAGRRGVRAYLKQTSAKKKLQKQTSRINGAKGSRPKNRFKELPSRKTEFVRRAVNYAKRASADAKGERFGIWIRLAAKRFLEDLDRAKRKDRPFYFDEKKAEHVCRWIECLPHVEGKWSTPNIVLADAQVFFLVNLFGFWIDRSTRRFSVALFAVARKNAKSTLAAAIMLYVMCEEDELGGQIYAAATTGDQARVVWRIAKQMVERCFDLREQYGVEAYSLEIRKFSTSTFFKAINAKASTQDGLNPQAFVLDELHAHKTHDLMNVLRDAAGARSNPLFLYTTTEGFETPGPWPEVRLFAQNILRGLEADHFLAVIFSLDEEDKALGTTQDDDFDETKYVKANPLWDDNPILRQTVRALAAEAKSMPGKLGEFRIKRLNRQASAAKVWVDILQWKQCAGPRLQPEDLVGMQCWGAFDLSSTSDMAAWALLFTDGEHWYVFVRYFVPREAVKQRTERRSATYAAWVQAGWVTETEGNRVDYAVVRQAILEDVRMFNPAKIAYDPWNAQQLVTELTNEGLELEVFVQGPRSYHPAMQALDVAYNTGTLRHGGNPVLQWNAANLVPRYDVNLNMAPDRKKSADKIDGMCATLMAFGLAIIELGDDSGGFFTEPVAA